MSDVLDIISCTGVRFQPDPQWRPEVFYKIGRFGCFDGIDFCSLVLSTVARAELIGQTFGDLFAPVEDNSTQTQQVVNKLLSILFGMPEQFEEVIKFVCRFLEDENGDPISPEDFRTRKDPETGKTVQPKMPMGAWVRIAYAVQSHPDLQDFLVGVRQAKKTLTDKFPQLAALWAKASTISVGVQETSVQTNGGNDLSTSSGSDTD